MSMQESSIKPEQMIQSKNMEKKEFWYTKYKTLFIVPFIQTGFGQMWMVYSPKLVNIIITALSIHIAHKKEIEAGLWWRTCL